MANHKCQQQQKTTKKINYGTLTQIESSQTIEATAERLSLSEPATHPIGMVGKLGSASPRHSHGNSREEAISGEEEEEWEILEDRWG